MQRCDKIYNHPHYRAQMAHIEEAEKDRKFCLHNLSHSFDVARIGRIMILEQGLDIDTELFYAAALLHDAGRYSGIPHNEAGAELAERIMPECGFTNQETELVAGAIRGHRTRQDGTDFSSILYAADKKSRLCFDCMAADECYWSNDKRNMNIEV
ncbi:MAG: HD domain-containing protein [Candidatus Ornithomonoglobus sp.]